MLANENTKIIIHTKKNKRYDNISNTTFSMSNY